MSQQPLSFSEARRVKQGQRPWPGEYCEEGLAKALGLIDAVLIKGVCLIDMEVDAGGGD